MCAKIGRTVVEVDHARNSTSRSPTRNKARILKLTGTLADDSYKVADGELIFERALHGLRNTVPLPCDGGLAVGHDWPVPRPIVRRADQPERGKSVQSDDPRTKTLTTLAADRSI